MDTLLERNFNIAKERCSIAIDSKNHSDALEHFRRMSSLSRFIEEKTGVPETQVLLDTWFEMNNKFDLLGSISKTQQKVKNNAHNKEIIARKEVLKTQIEQYLEFNETEQASRLFGIYSALDPDETDYNTLKMKIETTPPYSGDICIECGEVLMECGDCQQIYCKCQTPVCFCKIDPKVIFNID